MSDPSLWWFNGRDEKVSLLTRVPRVKLPDGWEDHPEYLVREEEKEGQTPLFLFTMDIHIYMSTLEFKNNHKGFNYSVHSSQILNVAKSINWINPILTALSDNKDLKLKYLKPFIESHSKFLHAQNPPNRIVESRETDKNNKYFIDFITDTRFTEDYEVKISDLRLGKSTPSPLGYEEILSELLWNSIESHAVFFRCAECGNPALRVRQWQKFCTFRCQNTANVRMSRTRKSGRKEVGQVK